MRNAIEQINDQAAIVAWSIIGLGLGLMIVVGFIHIVTEVRKGK